MYFARYIIFSWLIISISGCAFVDNYWLGVDNSPSPSPLVKFNPKVTFKKLHTKSVGRYIKRAGIAPKMTPVIDGNYIVTATSGGDISFLERSSKRLIWQQRLKTKLISGPAVSREAVAISDSHAYVYVINKSTGKLSWRRQLANQVLAKPIFAQNKIYIKTVDGHLYALDAHRGNVLWTYQHPMPKVVLRIDSSPLYTQGKLIAGFANGEVVAFDANTGRMLWKKSTVFAKGESDVERMVDIAANPIAENDRLYIASYQGNITALSLNNLHVLWQHPLSTYQNFIMGTNSLFLTDTDGQLWAFDKKNGSVQWRQSKLAYRKISMPAYANGRLYVTDGEGYLHALSSNTGNIIGRYFVGKAKLYAPVARGNLVYILDNKGTLMTYEVQ